MRKIKMTITTRKNSSQDTLFDVATGWLPQEIAKADLNKSNVPITVLNPD